MNSQTISFIKEQQERKSAEVAEIWVKIEDCYIKKLWHQLTEHLLHLVKLPELCGDVVNIYKMVIKDLENKFNKLSLAEFCVAASKELSSEEAISFLESSVNKVQPNNEAKVLLLTATAARHLDNNCLKEAKLLIEEARAVLDNEDGVSQIHEHFYETSSRYFLLISDHAHYYGDALRHLGCIEDLSRLSDPQSCAFKLGLAALLGDNVYNFGELLAHPVLESLKDGSHDWLVQLLFAFNSGDIDGFNKLQPQWMHQKDLSIKQDSLREKVSLMALVELAFNRPPHNRVLTFDDISQMCQLDNSKVEILVMRALSLGLLRGNIDQVKGTLHVTWVQPRVLNLSQIGAMAKQVDHWVKSVGDMVDLLENKSGGLSE